MICRGEDKFEALMAEDDKLRKKLVRASGINTIGNAKRSMRAVGKTCSL